MRCSPESWVGWGGCWWARAIGVLIVGAPALLLILCMPRGIAIADDASAGGEPLAVPAQAAAVDVIRVERFELHYAVPAAGAPSLAELARTPVTLGRSASGWMDRAEGVPSVEIRLDEQFADPNDRFHSSALRAINAALMGELSRRGVRGALVSVDANDVDPSTGRDLRPLRASSLRLEIFTSQEQARGTLRSVSSALPQDGGVYEVQRFAIAYASEHPGHPPIGEMSRVRVTLGQTATGFVAPRAGVPTVTVRLHEHFAYPEDRFYASAIQRINLALVAEFNRRSLVGVIVKPDARDIASRTGEDLRRGGSGTLRLQVYTARVRDIRTFASGDRVTDADAKTDNAVHRRIIAASPIQPDGVHDLLWKDQVDEYVARLNRHPGRRVDTQVTRGRKDGDANLDYLVAELKPWIAYAEFSNTGTENTTEQRQRFGFRHNQLTGHDDILSIDYITGNFDEVQAVTGMYDMSISEMLGATEIADETLFAKIPIRFRTLGLWNTFDSSQVGFPGSVFHGESWQIGAQLLFGVFQHREFFVDVFAGFRVANVKIDNELALTTADATYQRYQVGIRSEYTRDTGAIFGSAMFEGNLGSAPPLEEFQNMGRGSDVDNKWNTLRWDTGAYVFLEPLLFGDAWRDPSTPLSSTMAHELYVGFRGQWAFDSRLIPYELGLAGGLYSVRGYEEAEASGDSALVTNIEYRLHVPRLFRPGDPADVPIVGPFRMRPRQVYGQPDWDFVIRAFFDLGRTSRSNKKSFERNETLMGAGVGLDLVLLRYVSARVDFGWALRDTRRTSRGDARTHFAVRIQY